MGSTSAEKLLGVKESEGSETMIEIKIKTLDSQTYTLRVDKQVPVPALKEQIASVTGVVSEQQRLICRGRVLKDDQLLSAYHVEDGHTLHMVVRQSGPPSSESAHNNSGSIRSSSTQGGPSVVIEAFSLPEQIDGVPPEVSQILSAVLGSIGLSSVGTATHGIEVRDDSSQRSERTSVTAAPSDSSQLQPEQPGSRVQPSRPMSAFGIPASVSLGSAQPPVIPDSLTTLSQYLSQMRQGFDESDRSEGHNAEVVRNSETASLPGTGREGLPTPASLGEIMLATRQMLVEQAGDMLLQLGGQLENQGTVTDLSTRMSTQSNAWRTGVVLHNLGAFLLELGRTTMTARLGQSPSEAVVNAGPAVFISPSGPNPLMVQPLPFQPGTSFSSIPTGSVQAGAGLLNSRGTGFLPRRIDIQIRRGGSSTATPNTNQEERINAQMPSAQGGTIPTSENFGSQTTSRNSESSSFGGETGVRVVPIRTMVAAVPAPFSRLPSDSSGNSMGLYYPLMGRLQHVASGLLTGERVHQATGEQVSAGVQTENSAVQQRNTDDRTRNGSLPTPSSIQQEPSIRRSVNVSVLSAGGSHSSLESDERIPSSVLHVLRTLFPGGEIHVEDSNSHRPSAASVPVQENAPTAGPDPVGTSSGGTEAAAAMSVNEEGEFLSNLLHQIMPVISQRSNAEQNGAATASEHRTAQDASTDAESSSVGRSRRQSDSEPSPPTAKRHKAE